MTHWIVLAVVMLLVAAITHRRARFLTTGPGPSRTNPRLRAVTCQQRGYLALRVATVMDAARVALGYWALDKACDADGHGNEDE